MSDKRIDVPQVLDDLQAVVSEKGDGFVYVSPDPDGMCRYRDYAGAPSCIAAHVLDRHGLAQIPSESIAVDAPGSSLTEHLTLGALRVLRAAQESQDQGDPWGDALIAAKNMAIEVSP